MSSIGFITGLKAMNAAQLSMQTAGHNIANAHVDGYSRQTVEIATDTPLIMHGLGFLGTGVKASAITRSVDNLLEARIRVQNRSLGRLDKESFLLSQVEEIYNEPSDGGLASLFTQFFSSLNNLAMSPTDPTLRSEVVLSAEIMTDAFNTLDTRLNSLRDSVEDEIEAKVGAVNTLAAQITELSYEITKSKSAQMEANELNDRRNQLIKELNYYVDSEVAFDNNGNATVMVDGRILSTSSGSFNLELSTDAGGELYLNIEGQTDQLRIRDGELKELFDQQQTGIPKLLTGLDNLAKEMAYAFNRIHSTGIPLSGPFTSLKSEFAVQDLNLDLVPGNEPLSESGLAHPPGTGSLFITVTNTATGAMEQTEISIDPDKDSLINLASDISGIANLSAFVDSKGKLNFQATSGYTFDFAPRLNRSPDQADTLGHEAAMIGGSATYPVTLNAGDSLVIAENGVNLPAVTFAAGTFSANQIVSEINSQTGLSLASVVDGRVVLKSITPPAPGNVSTLQITNAVGSPAATLGMTTVLESGSDKSVTVALDGQYSGADNTNWRFEASGTGTIGVTPGLTISVFNDAGDQIAVLDVGEGYSPGDLLEVGDGVEVSFSSGDISSTSGDFFNATMIADSDSAGILASLGLNTFFSGSTAADLSIQESLLENPSLIAAALDDIEGNNQNMLQLAELKNTELSGLNNASVTGFYSTSIGQLGIEKNQADYLYEVQDLLMTNLENQRASISGVSIDEEMINLDKFQQMLEAATRYLQILSEVNDTIMTIGR